MSIRCFDYPFEFLVRAELYAAVEFFKEASFFKTELTSNQLG